MGDSSDFLFCSKCSHRVDVIGPNEILDELGDKFFQKATSTEWFKRKDAMEQLLKILKASPRLKDGDYRPLLNHLRKIILTDLCVIVVVLAVQCVTYFARGLRKHFCKYAEGMCRVLFEKFGEKRHRMTENLREAVDTIFETTKFEYFQNIVIRLLGHRNPTVRYELILFLARSFPKSQKKILNQSQMEPLYFSMSKLLNDADIVIRDRTLAAFGAAMQVAGKKKITPYIHDLDSVSKAKIDLYQKKAWAIAKTYKEMKFPNVSEQNVKQKISYCPVTDQVSDKEIGISQAHFISGKDTSLMTENDSVTDNTDCETNFHKVANEKFQRNVIISQTSPSDLEKVAPGHDVTSNMSNEISDVDTVITEEAKALKHDSPIPPENDPNSYRVQTSQVIRTDSLRRSKSLNHLLLPTTESELDIRENEMVFEIKKKVFIQSSREYNSTVPLVSQTPENEELVEKIQRHRKSLTEMINQSVDKTVQVEKHSSSTRSIGNETDYGGIGNIVDIREITVKIEELNGLIKLLTDLGKFKRDAADSSLGHRSKPTKQFKRKQFGRHLDAQKKHQEIQCESGADLSDHPTQTSQPNMVSTVVGPESVRDPQPSCILSCCNECARLLLATSPLQPMCLVPLNGGGPSQKEDQSDVSLCWRMLSDNRIQTKSEFVIESMVKAGGSIDSKTTNFNMEEGNEISNSKNPPKESCSTLNCGMCECAKPKCYTRIQGVKWKRKNCDENKAKKAEKEKPRVSTCDKNTYVTSSRGNRKRKRPHSDSERRVQVSMDSLADDGQVVTSNLYSVIPFVENHPSVASGTARIDRIN